MLAPTARNQRTLAFLHGLNEKQWPAVMDQGLPCEDLNLDQFASLRAALLEDGLQEGELTDLKKASFSVVDAGWTSDISRSYVMHLANFDQFYDFPSLAGLACTLKLRLSAESAQAAGGSARRAAGEEGK